MGEQTNQAGTDQADTGRQDQQRDQSLDRQQNQQNRQQGEDASGAGYGNNAESDGLDEAGDTGPSDRSPDER